MSDQPTYEEAISELEGIVEKVSRGNLRVDELVQHQRRSVELRDYCRQILLGVQADLESSDAS